MKKSDFKEHREIYIESCKKIITKGGACGGAGEKNVPCSSCPFPNSNTENNKTCGKTYRAENMECYEKDPKLLKSAKKYLLMMDKVDESSIPDTIDDSLIYNRNIIVVE